MRRGRQIIHMSNEAYQYYYMERTKRAKINSIHVNLNLLRRLRERERIYLAYLAYNDNNAERQLNFVVLSLSIHNRDVR